MTVLTRLLFGVLGAATLGASLQEPPAAGKDSAPKSILWSRTWEGALREAKIRNVPIYILVSIGEG
jgi:hypothetical protein